MESFLKEHLIILEAQVALVVFKKRIRIRV